MESGAFIRRYMLAPSFEERLSLAGVFIAFAKTRINATHQLKAQIHLYNQDMAQGVPLEGVCTSQLFVYADR